MTYKEALAYSFTVEWKTTPCETSDCWCMMIEPATEIKDDDGHEIYIAGAGSIPKDYAEHIVKLHNQHIQQQKTKQKE